jgi:hypothetical protein
MSESPLADVGNELYARGWRGVLPLPVMEKSPPPAGYTGAGGRWPSGADVWTWTEEQPAGNVALRMPPSIIGLDVDNYAGKAGAETLAKHVEQLGPLPATWRSTSRDDELSGIYLYRVPEGLFWPGELGPHVEIIQTRHRYAVVPPSVHPSGRQYRWIDPSGVTGARLPAAPGDIVPLPQVWVDELSGGRLAVDVAKSGVDYATVGSWFQANEGRPCGKMRTVAGRAVDELARNSSARHDIGVRAVMSLVYASAEGHRGAATAVESVRAAFMTAVTSGSSARDDETARREWGRIVLGALSVLSADGSLSTTLDDPCANPLDGILMPSTLAGSTLHDELSALSSSSAFADDSAPASVSEPQLSETEQRELMRQAIEAEAVRIRIRREARTLVDQEDALRSFRKPRELFTLADELAQPEEPVHFRIDELMPAGSNVLITAMFKSGKTTLVNHVTRCLVDALPVLGRYACEPLDDDARVGIWNYEVSSPMYVRWLRDAGVRNTDRVSLLNLRGHSMPLRADVVRAYAVDWLVSHNVRVWVLDPFARAFLGSGDSENDNAQVGAFLEMLDDIKREAGVSELIMPTHTGRAEMGAGTERSRGATRLDDWADVRWLLVRDKDGTRYFRASGRDVETEEATLEFNPLTRDLRLVDGNRADAVDEQRDDGRRSRVADQEVLNAVMFEIGEQPGCSLRTLREAVTGRLHVRNQRVDDAVRRLAQQRLVLVQETHNGHRHWLQAQVRDD